MAGEGGTVNDLSPADVAGRLRVLLAAIEAEEIEADLDHTAYYGARRMRWQWRLTSG